MKKLTTLLSLMFITTGLYASDYLDPQQPITHPQVIQQEVQENKKFQESQEFLYTIQYEYYTEFVIFVTEAPKTDNIEQEYYYNEVNTQITTIEK